MNKDFSIKLTIWCTTLFLAGAIMLTGGLIKAGIFFILIGSIIEISI